MRSPLFQESSCWPVRARADLVVVGAGPGGLGAALGAARLGKRVLILERNGFPGGVASTASCPYLMGFAVEGQPICGGVADDLVRELDSMDHARFRVGTTGTPESASIGERPLTGDVLTSIEGVRVAYNRLFARAEVERLYYTTLLGAVVEERRIKAIAIDNADGPGLIEADLCIDATGDASLVWRAGGEVREASPDESMTKSILFRMGGVQDFHRENLAHIYEELHEKGAVPFANQDHLMAMELLNPGEVLLNFTLTAGNGLCAADLSRMDGELREQVIESVAWFRQSMPGFRNAFLVDAAVGVGVRWGRNIVGHATITATDLMDSNSSPEPIALTDRAFGGHGLRGFHSDSWGSKPGVYGIPRGALIPVSFDNVLAAGRCISCESKTVSAFRLMARCICIGQAAGVNAALAHDAQTTPRAVPYPAVRQALLGQNAILE